jgi:hypothetical protein
MIAIDYVEREFWIWIRIRRDKETKRVFFFMCVIWNYSLCRALDDDSRNDSKNLFTYRKVSSSDVKIVSAFRRTNFMVLGPPL